MATRTLFESLKAGARYFISAVGGVSLVLGVVALVVPVGVAVSFAIIVVAGVGCAGLGIYQKYQGLKKEELLAQQNEAILQQEKQHRQQVVSMERGQEQLLGVTHDLDQVARSINTKVSEIVALEQKREEKGHGRNNFLEAIDLRIHISDNRASALNSPRFFSPAVIRKDYEYVSPDSNAESDTSIFKRRASI
ncbi:MAG: hypothetical protein P4M14_05930 [Gammaproteobacteria bacterium]|nr:hypothetical protein [Gammaproteobacteria bacterium]